jgi:SAM-dependent methyltransferase
LEKFTEIQNKTHWNKYAKQNKNNLSGASYDSNLVDLENYYIFLKLKKFKPNSLLDIGCGNGQRTKLFSKYVKGKTLGIDYSENMIKQAKTLENTKLSFKNANISNYSDLNKYDVIVSCRCFINQTSSKNQLKLFQILHSLLKKNGHLIIAEASVEGLKNLNSLRKSFGLDPIEEHWFNLHLKEKLIFPKISNIFEINDLKRLGLFYYLARVVHPASIFPKEAKKISKINTIATKSQKIFFENDHIFEQFGRHLLIDFNKKN